MTKLFKKIADSSWFQNTVTVAILIAGVLVGIATYADFAKEHETLLTILNDIILYIFIVEILVKMFALGKKPWLFIYGQLEYF